MDMGLNRLSVLIVDDNAHMISIVRCILLGFGITKTWQSRDAAEALAYLRQEPVDIAITDLQMPLLDGLEFTRLVRTGADVHNPFLPIIMLTAHTERSRILAARDAGVTEICVKPINARELWAKIAAVVNQPRPFVRTRSYVGPDRRRRVSSFKGEERRSSQRAPQG
jgi:two-component system chemotaxis response regulator CheY